MDKIAISTAGYKKLTERLLVLKETERPAILEAIQKARELGDLSENADYSTAKDAERAINSEIRRLEGLLEKSDVIDVASLFGDTVMFGARVNLEDEDGKAAEYLILSEYESDLARGIIAVTSPVGRALIGKKTGDFVTVKTPSGVRELEIMGIRYGA